ncbi:MAG: hypothetical protein AAFU55_11605, partial [Pseudomonadota bacterium]
EFLGVNIIGVDTATANGSTVVNADAADIFKGGLSDNGGPVKTIALDVDPANPALDAASGGIDTGADARGFASLDIPDVGNDGADVRDLGAYEASPSIIVVTNANDSGAGSLRQAIADAGTTREAIITFADNLDGQTINLQSALEIQAGADISITGDIDGDGEKDITISGDRTGNGRSSDDVRLFDVAENGALTLEAITLADGYQRGADGRVFLDGNGYIYDFTATGSATSVIQTAGAVTLSSVDITDAYARGGSGDITYAYNNVAGSDAGLRSGEAATILVTGTGALTTVDTLITGTEAIGGDGGTYLAGGYGGGDAATILIQSQGEADIARTGFGDNTATAGDGGYGQVLGGSGGDAAIGLAQGSAALSVDQVGGVNGAPNIATAGDGGGSDQQSGADGTGSFFSNGAVTDAYAYGNGNDAIAGGGEGPEKVILGFGGVDQITLGAENDTVFAGDGGDTVFVGSSQATQTNAVRVYGQGGDDAIFVNDANGAHIFDGGKGVDRLNFALAGDADAGVSVDLT